MRKDEFVALHGEEIWQQEVAPRQTQNNSFELRCNANIIVHTDLICVWLERMEQEDFIDSESDTDSLLKAKEMFLARHRGNGAETLWQAVLAYCKAQKPILASEECRMRSSTVM